MKSFDLLCLSRIRHVLYLTSV